MRIAICDDDLVLCDSLKNEIYEYSNIHNLEPVVDIYNLGEELVNTSLKYDVIILDYQMPGINGLETAHLLRCGVNAFACIIFLTCYPQIAISAYEVDTYRFVVKDTLYEGLFKALDDYRKNINKKNKLMINSEHKNITIFSDNIVFFEVFDKLTFIHLKDGTTIKTRCPLSKLYKSVPHVNFVQVHKSYVVNFMYITQNSKNSISMYNFSKEIPISRNYSKGFKNKYTNYLKDNA